MSDFNKRNYYIDLSGLFSLGIFSLGYIVTLKGLAEKHIQLPFLNFPIFVGEILLFVCLLLFLAKYINNPPEVIKWRHYLILCYFVFVIIKALHGYFIWDSSPLALRHAALLYYPAFAVFGYSFYRRDFFSTKNCLILILLIAVVFIFGKYKDSGPLTLMLLGFILIKACPDKTLRLLMFLVFLVIVPYKAFFHTARMMIVGNFVSGLYLTGALPLILEVKKQFKFALMVLIGGIVIVGLLKFADHGAVKSIISFKKMAEVMKSCDTYIEANIDNFQMEQRKEVKFYNPDKPVKNNAAVSTADTMHDRKTAKEGQEKLEVRKIIVEDVTEKIASFSFDQVDEETQGEVKQEIESILTVQLPGETGSIRKEARQTEDRTQKNGGAAWKSEIESPLITIHEPSQKLKGVEKLLVKREGTETGATELKARMRQIFFAQVKQEIRMAPVESREDRSYAPTVINSVKDETQTAFTEEIKQKDMSTASGQGSPSVWVENNNAVFRLLIWRDMLTELVNEKPIFGFSLGRPLRSRSLEMLHWGDGDWARDGWIEPHNSYLHIIYRTGIVGILLISSFLFILFKMIKHFILIKSTTGILLCGIIINWFVAANFLVILELPYTAIPIWTIYGMTFAYCYKTRKTDSREKTAL